MQGIEYIYELCEALPRSGPGDNVSTAKAYAAIPAKVETPLILDIGCGQGMQTIELAKISRGKIIAVDNHQGFLDLLLEQAKSEGLEDNVVPQNMSMQQMNFRNEVFDIIWSEGALYNMGFENGLRRCYQLLKPGGSLALTELVYLAAEPPAPVVDYFQHEYPDIADVASKIKQIEKAGFSMIDHFTLPESSWLDNYYGPMEQQLPRLNDKYQDNKLALSVFADFQAEVDLYRQYSQYFGYEFLIMHKD
ncbi:MAG: class I SAM-dependent methyltransferase [Gammaproteobacteria bacterium]|nr:class I SAM-dependent methyltransferase [Gammaproteobacteria bacterium]